MTRWRVARAAATAVIALTITWLVSQPEPEPVELAPIYVPRPLPENCGMAFGDVWCWGDHINETGSQE